MPRTYACCYCNQKFNRYKLPKHMESHESEIPENLTPYQVAYDIINDHPDHHGRCTICGKITNWSSKNQKYHRICRDPKCAQAIKKTYQERMMKVYNKPHLMDDVNHLEKMLAHRKISGKYKWSDGTEFTYTGSYEKNFLEFLDKVMNYESREIVSPGPVLEYDYKGKKHKWITDVMILPYNLIVEIKDGGDNKNGNKAWKGTREKTIAKEVMITNLGKYNYIRLTNNDFAQFLGIIAELKMQIVDDTVSPLYRIHENTSLDEGFIKDGFMSVISGVQKFNRRINDLEKKNKQSYSKPQSQPKPKITEKALKLKNNILQMKPSYGLNYENCVALTSVIDSIPEDKLVNYLYKYGGYSFSELMEDRDESSDKQIKQFFKGKKLTKTLCDEGEFDLFFYCYDTKKWYQYHHEDEPCISINKAMSYSTMKQEFKKSYEIDELDEQSLPEAVDKEIEYLHEGFLDTIKGLTPTTQTAIEHIKAPLNAMITGEYNGKKLDNVTRFIGASADALTSAAIYLPAGILLDVLLIATVGWLRFLMRNEKELKPEDLPKVKQQILKIQESMKKCRDASNYKRYNDLYWKLDKLKAKYNVCAKANGIKPLPKGSIKEESLPEAIDNPYMLREAQEWEHLTHMWSNAIDDIIGNVTNSPFEVNKGSYIDHDPETGKEVCVMRTIRPKAELKNREYRDRLKKQMYHLQQKINKAYNVHPSVMFIQYPIDNTNLTEGLIIGITKTSR